MADPVNTIVDHIPLTNGAGFLEYFNNTLYCTGDGLRRINPSTKQVTEIGTRATSSFAIAAVDFHRPFPVPPDVIGSGQPDGRIYISTVSDDFVDAGGMVSFDDFEAAEIVPPLLDQFTQFKLSPQAASNYRPFVTAMVVSNSGRYLYFFDVRTIMLGVVDLESGPRTLGAFQLDNWSMGMVISPDDRFIYVAHPFDNMISVVDTTAWPPSVTKVPVVNGPFGLALSADGKRLFVAQTGDSGSGDPSDLGTGTLSVIDTETMQGVWLFTGENSIAVAVNSTGTRAYVSNNNANTVSVVDVTETAEIIDTITGFTFPGFMRLSSDDRRLYVTDSGASPGIAVAAV
jgi:DNA-binding beta-propeller fold protein YncE